MEDFSDVLSPSMLSLMKKKGFSSLTAIQKRAMPEVARNRNVLILAPTGWGKTEAAMLPILSRLGKRQEKSVQTVLESPEKQAPAAPAAGHNTGIRVLYITPLRALNRDMVDRIEWWCSQLSISVSVRHGDTGAAERQQQSRNPPQVLITTPETLQAILPAKRLGKHLETVETVIVDEVHELFSDKRGAQLSLALERLVAKRGSEFQRIGLSATVGNPEQVARFLFGGRPGSILSEGSTREMHVSAECPEPDRSHESISEKLSLDGASTARLMRLHSLCMSHRATLIFVNTRRIGEMLASRMRLLEKELGEKVGKIAVHHGSLARDERIQLEKQFKSGELKGLIATSSLELGMDIGDVDLVVQYMSPRQVSRLLQRVGRSGHAISKIPKGIVIASDADDILESAAIIEGLRQGQIESERMQEGALDVLAHQLAGLVMDWGEISLERAYSIVKRAAPYEKTEPEKITAVARQLSSQRCVFLSAEGILKKGGHTFDYYFGNLSMIPREKKFPVRNAATNKFISSLDEAFASTLEPGSTFITKGVPWKVLDANEEEVLVEPSGTFESAIPDWVGEEIPVPFWVAQESGRLRQRARNKERLENSAESCTRKAQELLAQQDILPDQRLVLVESCENTIVIHSCIGSKGNEALGRALAELLTASMGSSVRAEIDPYRIALLMPHPVKAEKVADIIRSLGNVQHILEKSVPRSSLFRYRFLHVGRAFGAFSEHAKITSRIIEHLRGTPVHDETMREIFSNYLDIGICNEFLLKIREGKIDLFARNVPELSPLGRAAVVRISASELISPLEPTSEVLKAFKRQLFEKRVRMLCTYCGKLMYKKLADAEKKIKCESCGSSLVAIASEREEKAWRKAREKRNREEAKTSLELMRSASLIDAYGKRGAIALSVYGVGPDTAARILARLHQSEDLLLIDLLEAQKNFIKTKRYWSA